VIDEIVSGRTILLTGAGGSIGSALAKALVRLEPRRLILLDNSERNLNEIDSDIPGIHRDKHISVLGDICDTKLLSEIFHRYRPEIVYHAAAFKHVPLMENNPFAAVRNNALGTANLARMSQAEGVAIFVMVSTDKAVNPMSVMGVSKRVAELALLSLNNSQNQMSALRLGNVLGSHGSVVPTFLRQISQGGPVTVTHPDVSRYFLTIHDAVELILLTSSLDEGGGVLIPHLRAPVKILDIAHELIGYARSKASKDIPITFIGLRSGDKMSEDFLEQDESAEPTVDPRLFRVKTKEIQADKLDIHLHDLSRSVAERDLSSMIETLCRIVPAYRPTQLLCPSTEGSSV
jgi:FlaA1/EpsC-like NDP-sugar epimerase